MALSKKRRLHDGRFLRINTGITPKGRNVVQIVLKDSDKNTIGAVVVNQSRWTRMANEIDGAATAIRRHFNPHRAVNEDFRCLDAIADLPEGLDLSALKGMDIEDVGAEESPTLTA